MGNFFLGLIGVIFSFTIMKYREAVGDMIGEADWMYKLGGVYNVILLVAFGIFLFSIATMTGTTDILLAPILLLFPGGNGSETPTF